MRSILRTVFIISLLHLSQNLLSQESKGSVRGRLTMVDGEPMASKAISLLELQRTTLTDEDGKYIFKGLDTGNYTIRVQLLGAKEIKIPVHIGAPLIHVEANYQMSDENVLALQEVVVHGKTTGLFKKKVCM